MAGKTRPKSGVNFGPAKSFEILLKKRGAAFVKKHGKPGPKVSLALNVFEQRKKKGWTQMQAHEKSGVAYNTYLDIEQAQPKANPSADTLIALAEAFGCSMADLWRERKGIG